MCCCAGRLHESVSSPQPPRAARLEACRFEEAMRRMKKRDEGDRRGRARGERGVGWLDGEARAERRRRTLTEGCAAPPPPPPPALSPPSRRLPRPRRLDSSPLTRWCVPAVRRARRSGRGGEDGARARSVSIRRLPGARPRLAEGLSLHGVVHEPEHHRERPGSCARWGQGRRRAARCVVRPRSFVQPVASLRRAAVAVRVRGRPPAAFLAGRVAGCVFAPPERRLQHGPGAACREGRREKERERERGVDDLSSPSPVDSRARRSTPSGTTTSQWKDSGSGTTARTSRRSSSSRPPTTSSSTCASDPTVRGCVPAP